MQKPVISVLMSIYQEPVDWIRQSVESILTQTFTDFEFIIVNDKPDREENRTLLEEYKKKDNRIVIITNKENIGLTKSLNKGLSVAQGVYIARMDADDVSLPGRFEKQVSYMESNPNVIVLGTKIKYIGDSSLFDTNNWIKICDSDIKAQLLINSCFAHPTVLIRKVVLDKYHIFYDEDYKQAQDYRLWEVLKNYGDFANLKESFLLYRVSSSQVSKKHNTNSNNNATIIRRRLIMKVLGRCDIKSEDYFNSNIIKARNVIEKKSLLIGKTNLICLKKSLYFSTDKKRIYVFFKSILNGDFFELNFFEKVFFLKIIAGIISPVPI